MAGAIVGRGDCRRDPAAVYASVTDLTNRSRHGDVARRTSGAVINGNRMSVKPMQAQPFTAPAQGPGWPPYPRRACEMEREGFEDRANQSTGLKPAAD